MIDLAIAQDIVWHRLGDLTAFVAAVRASADPGA